MYILGGLLYAQKSIIVSFWVLEIIKRNFKLYFNVF